MTYPEGDDEYVEGMGDEEILATLPHDIEGLLTDEQRDQMHRDLAEIARRRRRVEAASRGIVLP